MSQPLIDNLPLIAAAPNGIKALRGLILDLAVRGKLVPQDPQDEPASELLKRIAAEKAQLIASGVMKKGRAIRESASELPFSVPGNWVETSLSEICSFENGDRSKNYPSRDELVSDGIPFINAGHLVGGAVCLDDMNFITPERFDQLSSGKVADGDILYCLRGSLGKAAVVRGINIGAIASSLVIVRSTSLCEVGYIFTYLSSGTAEVMVRRFDNGTAQPNLSAADLARFAIPLPPLAEQRRIVAKVDELMALCDRLEAQQADAETVHATLVKTLLDTLTQSQDADDFATNWHRLSQHFPTIFTTEASVDALKQTVLQLAFMGKLVPTTAWPRNPLPLGSVASLQNGYAFKSEWFVPSGVRLLRNANVGHGVISWDEAVYLAEPQANEFERFRLNEGDIVLSLDRPFINSGTKVARVRAIDSPCLLLQRVGRFQVKREMISEDYLFLWIHSPDFTSQIDPGRSNGVPHISSKQVEAAEIFVPPLAEQHRIVAKVDELLALCDTLKAQIADSRKVQRLLTVALIDQTLAA